MSFEETDAGHVIFLVEFSVAPVPLENPRLREADETGATHEIVLVAEPFDVMTLSLVWKRPLLSTPVRTCNCQTLY